MDSDEHMPEAARLALLPLGGPSAQQQPPAPRKEEAPPVYAWAMCKPTRRVYKTMPQCVGVPWEDARYDLEKVMGMHPSEQQQQQPPQRKPSNLAYLVAYWPVDFDAEGYSAQTIPGNWVLSSNERILLARRAIPAGLKPYVPRGRLAAAAAAAPEAEEEEPPASAAAAPLNELDELALVHMAAFAQDTVGTACAPGPQNRRQAAASAFHASAYRVRMCADGVKRVVPPPTYVCHACTEVGAHFRDECPRGADGLALDRTRVLHGVPKSRLRDVDTATETRLVTGEGKRVETLDLVAQNEPVLLPGVCGQLLLEGDYTSAVALRPLELEWLGSKANRAREDADAARLRRVVDFDFEEPLRLLDARRAWLEAEFFRRNPGLRRKKPQVCTFFANGRCQEGRLRCPYTHAVDARMPICRFFLLDQCRQGAACTFLHVAAPAGGAR
jgi:hypothetical protein